MSQTPECNGRAPRIERPFTVRICEKLSAEEPRWNIVTTKNISVSGVLFNYDRFLKPGSRLNFRISLPGCDPVECEGEVVRNVESTFGRFTNSEPGVCAVAAVFNLSKHDRKVMEEALAQSNVGVSQEAGTKRTRSKRIDRSFPFWMQREGQTDWDPVPMRNISESGVLITSQESLEVGAEISLRMMFPFTDSPVTCRGRVVRVDDKTLPGSKINFIDIGVEFFGLDETVKQKLNEYAEKTGRD